MSGTAPWTVKGMSVDDRRWVTAYAARHEITVAQAMSSALDLLRERERNTDIMAPPGQTDLGNTQGKLEANSVSDAMQLAPLMPFMPAWFRFRLARRLAPLVGIEAPEVRRRLPAPQHS